MMTPPIATRPHCSVQPGPYYEAGGSVAFLNSGDNKEKFEIIAGVILALQDDDSLTWAKDTYRVKFLMDNSEVYWGLRSMAKLEEVVFGDLTAAQTYEVKAEQIRQGIDNELFDLDTGLPSSKMGSFRTPIPLPTPMSIPWPGTRKR